jgi:hypothetical protein
MHFANGPRFSGAGGFVRFVFSFVFLSIHHFLTTIGTSHASVYPNLQCSTSWKISS